MLRLSRLMALLVLAAVALYVLRPTSLGGSVDYIVVHERDMEPSVESGDVLVVRRHDGYTVGDVVAVETLQGPFFGRVAAVDSGEYWVAYGSNRNPVNVAEGLIVGRAWVNLGQIGRNLSGEILEFFHLVGP